MNIKTHLVIGSLGLSIVTVGVLLTMHFSTTEPTPLDSIHFSAPEASVTEDDEFLGAEYIRYTSSSMGYEVRFPGTWRMDDSKSIGNSDVLSAPNDAVVVRIGTTALVENADMAMLEQAAQQIEESFRSEQSLTIQKLERGMWKDHPAVLMEGTRTTDSGEWSVRTYTVFRLEKHDMLVIQMNAENGMVNEEVLNSIEL